MYLMTGSGFRFYVEQGNDWNYKNNLSSRFVIVWPGLNLYMKYIVSKNSGKIYRHTDPTLLRKI